MSKDDIVCNLAKNQAVKEALGKRSKFGPFKKAAEMVSMVDNSNKKIIVRAAKFDVMEEDRLMRYDHTTSLDHHGSIYKSIDEDAANVWANTIWSLKSSIFKFALNAFQDVLPHNKNLHLWKKKPSPACPLCQEVQSLVLVLNNCPVALKLRRYNYQHDLVLKEIYIFICDHIEGKYCVTCDLPDLAYEFPQHIVCSELRPDIILWNNDAKSIKLIELTVPFEVCKSDAKRRKEGKYCDLVDNYTNAGWMAELITLEVGARGILALISYLSF